MEQSTIFTIGHSTRSAKEFIFILKSFEIELLVDIRLLPGSKRHPQFNKDELENLLQQNNICYLHLKDLGGRRKPLKNSVNTGWREEAFRGYADYMETEFFKAAIDLLKQNALTYKTVYMCSEAAWWSCHRSLVSDYLKVRGWKVIHIFKENKSQEHLYTQPARIVDGQLLYNKPDLFSE